MLAGKDEKQVPRDRARDDAVKPVSCGAARLAWMVASASRSLWKAVAAPHPRLATQGLTAEDSWRPAFRWVSSHAIPETSSWPRQWRRPTFRSPFLYKNRSSRAPAGFP